MGLRSQVSRDAIGISGVVVQTHENLRRQQGKKQAVSYMFFPIDASMELLRMN